VQLCRVLHFIFCYVECHYAECCRGSDEGEPHKFCKRFVRYQIDQMTYDTIWDVLDRRYGGTFDKTNKSWKSLTKSSHFPAMT
jgi:hypothetical protein